MEFQVLLFSLVCVVCARAVDDLNVEFKPPGIRNVKTHDNLELRCHINRNELYVVQNKVRIIRKSDIDKSEVILSEPPNNINMNPNYPANFGPVEGNGVLINITFTVTDQDEGVFICRVLEDNKTVKEDSVQVEIIKPLNSLHFEINSLDPDGVFPGNYPVACIAEGSNPAANVSVFFNGEGGPSSEIVKVNSKTELMDTKLKQFRVTVNATAAIKLSSSPQELVCKAQAQMGDNQTQITIMTMARNPEVNCSETQAAVGDKHVVLICTVEYEGFNISSYMIETGNVTVPFVDVKIENLTRTHIRVNLTLDEVKDYHFNELYVLLKHADGHITRVNVKLVKNSPKTGASGCSESLPFLVIFMFTLALWPHV